MELKVLIDHMKNNNIFQLIISSESDVFCRANLELFPLKSNNLTREEVEAMLHSIISKEKYEVFLKEKKLIQIVKFGDERLIVKAFINFNNIFFTVTILKPSLPDLEKLNLPAIIQKISNLDQGLIFIVSEYDNAQRDLACGLLNYLNTNLSKHIATLESPIYYHHKNLKSFVSQREIWGKPEILTKFEDMISENPDIFYFSEIYNRENAKLILDCAKNKLVIVNLRADSVISCLENFVNFFNSAEKAEILLKLSENLILMICQSFAKKLDATGLVPVFEFMHNNKIIKNLIKDDKIPQIFSQMNNSEHMKTMEHAFKELTEQKIIDSNYYKMSLAAKDDNFWLSERKIENF